MMSEQFIKFSAFAFLIILLTASARPAYSYRLPPYHMSAQEEAVPAESSLHKYAQQLQEIQKLVPIGVVENHRRDYKKRFMPKLRRAVKGFTRIKNADVFWEYVVDLKKDLMNLHKNSHNGEMEEEADALAFLHGPPTYSLMWCPSFPVHRAPAP